MDLLPKISAYTSVIRLTALLLLLPLGFSPAMARALDCSQVRISQRDGVLYADPSPTTRLRFKNDEAAVRLIGAFETNDSLYETLQNENQGVHLIGKRSGRSANGPSTAVEILAIRKGGKLLWSALYNGDNGNDQQQLLLSNLGADGSVSCEVLPKNKQTLSLDASMLDSSEFRLVTRTSTIADANTVYEQLGLIR